MIISRLIIIICILVISSLPGQNTSIFFLRDGSIVQGTVIDENQRRIFLKTDQGTLKILPENILGREVTAQDVAMAFTHLALSQSTVANVATVDGGNIAAALR